MTNKPNSDKSGRAVRRAAARELAKAPTAGVTPAPTVAQPPTVTAADLFAKIGALAVERDILAGQLEQAQRTIATLTEELQQGLEEEEPIVEEEK